MQIIKVATLLIFSAVTTSALAETYVCTPETAATLINLRNKWEVFPYDSKLPNVQKYVIKTTQQPASAAVYDQESNQKLFDCKYWFPEISAGTCEDGGNSIFKFLGDKNTRTAKYSASAIGFTFLFGDGTPTGAKQFSTIEQGTCLRVD